MSHSYQPADPVRTGALRCLFALALAVLGVAAQAQGGPPMVTDDPDTPGDGNWEINLAAIGQKNADGWLFTAADADLNYGWGQRLQLKLDLPWNVRRQDGAWMSGIGNSQFGVKWRFFDDDNYGWKISTYPQVAYHPDAGAVGRGLADPGRSVLLPIEGTTHLGPVDIDLEIGRELQQVGASNWIAGVLLAHTYANGFQIMLESREHWSATGSGLLINLGGRWQLSDRLTLLASAGREAGPADAARLGSLAYLGVQIHR